MKPHGRRIEVCRATFMDTFKVSKNMIEKMRHNIEAGVINVEEHRGTHLHHFQNPQALLDLINAQIQRFPKITCHYSRRIHEEYLSPDLNVSKMYRIFCEENPNIPNLDSKENLYRKVLQDSRLKIGPPKSDTCEICDEFLINIRAAPNAAIRNGIEQERNEHRDLADLAYLELSNDIDRSRNDATYVVIVGDLQKVLFTPTLTHSSMFYKRQLSSYNMCLYNGSDDTATMCTWSEVDGHRGVNEIGSCLLEEINANYGPLLDGQRRTLIYWSDRCRGQVNNYFMLALFKLFIARRLFTTIEQKFLYTGHSFLPCDRMFAIIEKRKKTATAIVPQEWVQIIRESRLDRPFRIREMNIQNIMNISSLDRHIPRPPTLLVTQHMRYMMTAAEPHLIFARDDYRVGVWLQPFIVYSPRDRRHFVNRATWTHAEVDAVILQRAYRARLQISAEKYDDLMSMVPLIMPQYRPYYINLPHAIVN
jgi:hypothetical protein